MYTFRSEYIHIIEYLFLTNFTWTIQVMYCLQNKHFALSRSHIIIIEQESKLSNYKK